MNSFAALSAAGSAAATGAAAQAVIAQAIKASGVIVHVEPLEFQAILALCEEPLVVHAHVTVFFRRKQHQYLTSFRGLAFYARSPEPIELPEHCPLIEAKGIWIPG
ncbi:MAG: hypothetical protein JJU36_08140 [Phycisphaeraceae bacterium]|nr:hypothetical protein [Phycisphaeraceae bacterium]